MTATPALEQPWVCCANQAVSLQLVDGLTAASPGGEEGRFYPTYTHQVFSAEETISGYRGLDILLSYNASTLAVRSRVAYAERRAEGDGQAAADDLDAPLAKLLDSVVGGARADTPEAFAAPRPPIGEPVHSYTRRGADGEEVVFEVRKATFGEPAARELNARITSLLLLFVDGASAVDESDHKWVTFTCYERRAGGGAPPRVVGYTTVYPFSAVLPGGVGLVERFRLSQILVLRLTSVAATARSS